MGEVNGQSFGSLLRSHRRAAGLSQEVLAQRAGLSVDAIAGLERGRRTAPHADTVGRLVLALELTGGDRDDFVRAAEPASRPVAEPTTIPRNLPVPLTSFVGRGEAVAALRQLLSSTRLLTLVGPGGIGKTRLALETARSLTVDGVSESPTVRFADGVWLADLSSVDEASAVPAAVAAALESARGPSRPSIAALTRMLAERNLLLVLDNCEHLIDRCAELADALQRNCPNVVILATSREALAIPGEVVWPVAALSVAEVQAAAKPDDVLRSEAGRLFAERASAVRPDFSLTDDNAATVAELCQQLDGIPLAIELAAARVNTFDVQTIVSRLADRFVLLKSGNRLAPPRHQTLHALVQWSYDLLSAAEQRLFARLALFAGGWDIEAVEAVGADDLPGATPTIELLARLVDKSLVVRTADQVGRTRYVLLETLRQFAAQLLAASGELQRVQELHAAYYLARLERIGSSIEGPHQTEHLQYLEQNIDNLRAALDWCVAADRAEPGLRGAWCLAVLAWLRGYLEEMAGRLALLLDLPSALTALAEVRARALVAAGYVGFYRGELQRAHRLVEDGLQLFRDQHCALDTGQALVWFGLIVDAEGNREQARRCFVEALQVFREVGDRFWIARAATNLGHCLAGLAELSDAIPLLREALALRRQLGDRRGVANTLHHLADAIEGSGDFRQARDLADEALSIAEAVGDRFVTVRALIGLGRVAWALHAHATAEDYLERAMAIARPDGFGHEVAHIAILLGFIARDAGDPLRGRVFAEDGLYNAQTYGRPVEAARAQFLLGSIAVSQAEFVQARASFYASLELYQQVPIRIGTALAAAGLASTLEDGARAAFLGGAAEAVVGDGGPNSWTVEHRELERTLLELHRRLGTMAAWTSGRQASLKDVVQESLAAAVAQRA